MFLSDIWGGKVVETDLEGKVSNLCEMRKKWWIVWGVMINSWVKWVVDGMMVTISMVYMCWGWSWVEEGVSTRVTCSKSFHFFQVYFNSFYSFFHFNLCMKVVCVDDGMLVVMHNLCITIEMFPSSYFFLFLFN